MALHHFPRIVTDGLVLCLDAGNPLSYTPGDSLWKDLSGNGNNGTLTGASYIADNKGTINFDGNDSVALSKTMSQMGVSDTSFTVCCFCNRSSSSNFFTGYLGFSGPTVSLLSTNNVFLNVYATSGSRYLVVTASPKPEDVWAHFSFSINANIVKTYFNGILSNTTTMDSNIQSVQNIVFSLGAGYGYYYYIGSISQVLMYDTVLSDDQILQNYLASKGRYGL